MAQGRAIYLAQRGQMSPAVLRLRCEAGSTKLQNQAKQDHRIPPQPFGIVAGDVKKRGPHCECGGREPACAYLVGDAGASGMLWQRCNQAVKQPRGRCPVPATVHKLIAALRLCYPYPGSHRVDCRCPSNAMMRTAMPIRSSTHSSIKSSTIRIFTHPLVHPMDPLALALPRPASQVLQFSESPGPTLPSAESTC